MGRQTKEEIAAQKRAYRLAHIDQITAREKARRAAKAQEITAKKRAYEAGHRTEKEVRNRAYAVAHRAEIAERKKAWRIARRAEIAAYKAARREQEATDWHNRNAKKYGCEGTHTVDEWRAMRDWFGNVCLRCGGTEKITRDHVVPITKGGANWVSNLQPLCHGCNSHKKTKTVDYRDPARLVSFLESLKQS
jgi:5-methylcytosine-specific restriction endonuclease McrA